MDEIPMTEQEEMQALVAAKPSWMTDGKGLQGDATTIFKSDAADQLREQSQQGVLDRNEDDKKESRSTQGYEPDPIQTRANGSAGGAPVGATKQVIVDDNGTLNYYNTPADFVGAV